MERMRPVPVVFLRLAFMPQLSVKCELDLGGEQRPEGEVMGWKQTKIDVGLF